MKLIFPLLCSVGVKTSKAVADFITSLLMSVINGGWERANRKGAEVHIADASRLFICYSTFTLRMHFAIH